MRHTQLAPDPRTVCSMLLATVEEMEVLIMGCRDDFHIKGISAKVWPKRACDHEQELVIPDKKKLRLPLTNAERSNT